MPSGRVLRLHAGQGAATGLREPLRDRDAEREPGVHDVGADPFGGSHAAVGQRTEARVARERHALLERPEGPPVEQVWGVHGVPRLPQLVGEHPHSVGQPLDVVVQQNLAHPHPPP